jgi:5-methylthioadenosine/S-adenosylhomocysteine deaminase
VNSTTIIRGGHVLTMGPAGDLRDGAVAVAGRDIVAVGPFADVAAAFPGATVVGDPDSVVLPGFVNAHNHLSEALICGMGSDMTLYEWGHRIIEPVGWHVTREMAHVGSLVKGAEMLLSGTTTVNDMFCYSATDHLATLGVADGLEQVGMRGVLSFGAADSEFVDAGHADSRLARTAMIDGIMREHEALADRCASSERQTFRMGIAVVHGQSDKLFDAGISRAKTEGWAVHTHIAEVREEITEAYIRWGTNTLGRANLHGLLDLEVIAAHCIWLNQYDISLLQERSVKVSHNPVANMILASGVCPVPQLRAQGITVGIGTDGAASNDSQNMLEAIKCAALIQKLHHLDARAITAYDVLQMATIDGARAVGLDHLVGSLEVGKRADVLRLHGDGPGVANVHDAYQRVVFCAGPRDVADVWVDGEARVRDGRITAGELSEWVRASKPLAAELVRRAGLYDLSALAGTAGGSDGTAGGSDGTAGDT